MNKLLQSSPLLLPAVAFAVGIVLGDRWPDATAWLVLMGAALLAVLALYRYERLVLVPIVSGIVALGGMRASSVRLAHDRVAWPDGHVQYEAVVVSEPAQKPKTVAVDIIMADGGRRLKCYVATDEHSRQLTIGDRLQLCSRIECNSQWRHGTFDYRRYLEVHGFTGQTFVRAGAWQRLSRSWQGLSVKQRLQLHFLCYRHTLLERYRQLGAEGERYAVVAAMTLGDKSAMSRELKDIYAVSGASHVLALSGLHLGIVYMMLSLLVVNRRLRGVSQVLIVVAIWAFALLVGLPASIVRSAVMISTYALLSLLHRGRPSLNALALAALCMLAVSPDSLFDVGFQLSFLAMLGILMVQPVCYGLVSSQYLLSHPLLRWLWGLITVSVAAQVGVAPMVAYYFGRFSTYFILTNLLVIPTTMAILYLALASLLLPAVGSWLLTVVGWLNGALTFMALRLPCASIEGLHPSALQVAMMYVVVIAVFLIVLIYDKRI